MKSINLIIIPEWGKASEGKSEFYDRIYEQLTANKVNVGFAPNKGVFLNLLNHVANQDDRFLFVIDEDISGEERSFVQERIAEIGYNEGWMRSLGELIESGNGMRKRLEGWLKDLRTSQDKERRG